MSEAKFINHRDRGKTLIGKLDQVKIDSTAALNDAIIDMTGGLSIGKNVHFGHQVMLLTTSHPPEITAGEERMKTVKLGKIDIEDDAYIGSRVIILKGVTIGKGSYIAAGSVVLEDTEIGERELWAGVPASLKRKL